MKAIATALFLLAAVCTLAAANPVGEDWLYISYDPAGNPNQNEISPSPYTTVTSYVFADFTLYGEGGWTTISFQLNDPILECPGVMATRAFANLLPGNLGIGDAFDGGITLASTECMVSSPVPVGRIDCFYLGGPCTICILDHDEYPAGWWIARIRVRSSTTRS